MGIKLYRCVLKCVRGLKAGVVCVQLTVNNYFFACAVELYLHLNIQYNISPFILKYFI